MLVVWERGELETGTDCYILTQSSFDHSSTSSSSWLGLLNRGSLRAQSPLSAASSQFGILSPTDSNSNWNWPKPTVAPGYIIVLRTPASAVPPLIYTGASLDWLLGRGSIYKTITATKPHVIYHEPIGKWRILKGTTLDRSNEEGNGFPKRKQHFQIDDPTRRQKCAEWLIGL